MYLAMLMLVALDLVTGYTCMRERVSPPHITSKLKYLFLNTVITITNVNYGGIFDTGMVMSLDFGMLGKL